MAGAQLQEEYGDDHTISEFCCITKVKNGKTKKRIILDLKKSGVSKRTRKNAPCRAAQTVGSGAGLARSARHQGCPSIRGTLCPGLL